jgi:hypothetical protein
LLTVSEVSVHGWPVPLFQGHGETEHRVGERGGAELLTSRQPEAEGLRESMPALVGFLLLLFHLDLR